MPDACEAEKRHNVDVTHGQTEFCAPGGPAETLEALRGLRQEGRNWLLRQSAHSFLLVYYEKKAKTGDIFRIIGSKTWFIVQTRCNSAVFAKNDSQRKEKHEVGE